MLDLDELTTDLDSHNVRTSAIGIMEDVRQFGVYELNAGMLTQIGMAAAVLLQSAAAIKVIARMFGTTPADTLQRALNAIDQQPLALSVA